MTYKRSVLIDLDLKSRYISHNSCLNDTGFIPKSQSHARAAEREQVMLRHPLDNEKKQCNGIAIAKYEQKYWPSGPEFSFMLKRDAT